MKHFKNSYKNSDFFKPQRPVWQKTVPKPETLKAKREEPSWEELMQTADFLEYAKHTCNTAKEEGKEALECRIRSLKEGEEIVRFKRFIDELGEKLLKQHPEFKYRTAKETSKRFKLLQEVADMQAIMTRFEEAESYEIVPYRRGKTPAMIVFEYPDGKTEEYPLELSTKQKHMLWETIKGGTKESEKKEKEIKWFTETEVTERTRYLEKPDNAYRVMCHITTYLPDEVMKDLSKPFSKIAEAFSHSEIDPETGHLIVTDLDSAIEESKRILRKHYGPDYVEKMPMNHKNDLKTIGEAFNIEI